MEMDFKLTADFDSEFGISITKDNFSTLSNVFLVQGMGKYFVNRVDEKRVDSNLNSILLKVYKIGEYCIDHNIKGNFSETGKYAPLAELRKYLKLGFKTKIKNKSFSRKSKDSEISELLSFEVNL